jgi:transglutaminase-like putative cysteine protease
MLKTILLNLTALAMVLTAQTIDENINSEISKGNYTAAKQMIEDTLKNNDLSTEKIKVLQFEIERMERIKKDFKKSEEDILQYIRKYIPNANSEMLRDWEDDGSLEYKIIDGNKFYFNRSHTNLFRINKVAKSIRDSITGKDKDDLDLLLERLVPDIIKEIDDNESIYGQSNKIKLTYNLTVPANKVPAGDTIKCWLPYPRSGHERQKIISFNSADKFLIADNNNLQRSVYFEKTSINDNPTIFQYELILGTKAVNFDIKPENISPYMVNSEYSYYTKERAPHIVFSEKIKKLSDTIIGDETNPYLIAKKIFSWISRNIPWAGAREYSTLQNISDYCISNMHGDCGIKTILFMTLARYNGIPTKWQSGWMLHPREKNLHDWCEAYFEGYGWVPVDQSFGIIESEDPRVRYFYLGGIDQYRFIVNDDYSQKFSPLKKFFRSETVDFQRGEVEWSKGNLYFDDWDYSMKIEYLE